MSNKKWTPTFPSGISVRKVERGDITKLGGPPPIHLIPAARKKEGNHDKATFCSLKLSNNSKDSYPKFDGESGKAAVRHVKLFWTAKKKLELIKYWKSWTSIHHRDLSEGVE